MKPGLALLERVLHHVDRGVALDSCWMWTGATDKDGYGVVKVDGVTLLAHRVMWKLAHGRSAPPDREVMHVCDTPGCVKPSHLRVATHAQNMADAARKGRARNQHSKQEVAA